MTTGVLNRSSRISPSNNRLNLISLRAHNALKRNEVGRNDEGDVANLQELLKLMAASLELIKPTNKTGVYRKFRSKHSSSDERLVMCFVEAANQYFTEEDVLVQLEKTVYYLRRYGFANTHKSSQYEKSKEFLFFLLGYHSPHRHFLPR